MKEVYQDVKTLKNSIEKKKYEEVSKIYTKVMKRLNVLYTGGVINTIQYKRFTTDLKDLCKSNGIVIK